MLFPHSIMRLLDTRFSGIARGVGTARILGRIHSAQIKVGNDLYLPCAFTVMEVRSSIATVVRCNPFDLVFEKGRGVDLLFGLDMLKRYQACIDLSRNVLRIQDREVRFLAEHELPRNALEEEMEADEHGNVKVPASQASAGAALGAAASASAAALGPAAVQGSATQKFPGSGNTLATQSEQPSRSTPAHPDNSSRWPETSISALTAMGVERTEALRLLDAANGNV